MSFNERWGKAIWTFFEVKKCENKGKYCVGYPFLVVGNVCVLGQDL